MGDVCPFCKRATNCLCMFKIGKRAENAPLFEDFPLEVVRVAGDKKETMAIFRKWYYADAFQMTIENIPEEIP